jgi:hypothetical protein
MPAIINKVKKGKIHSLYLINEAPGYADVLGIGGIAKLFFTSALDGTK